jgi:hypothetical protein
MHYGNATRNKIVGNVKVGIVNREYAGSSGRDAVVDVVRDQLGAAIPRAY